MCKEIVFEVLFGAGVTPEESKRCVKECLELFEEQESLKERALRKVFNQWPNNTDEDEVLVKITLLNVFYSTFLNNYASDKTDKIDIESMASVIVDIENFDELVHSANKSDQIRLVNAIRYCGKASKEESPFYDAYSFATKYCNWHNPKAFPIADRYSKGMVYYLACFMEGVGRVPGGLTQQALLDYETFCDWHSKVSRFVCERCGTEFSLKEIDEFFWLFGKQNGLSIS